MIYYQEVACSVHDADLSISENLVLVRLIAVNIHANSGTSTASAT